MIHWKKRVALLIGISLVGMMALLMSIPVVRRSSAMSDDFDIQVVLGGDTRERSEVSYALWQRHPTKIVVTGDQGYTYSELLRLGIPDSQLIHETAATSTWENAPFSLPVLRERRVTSAALVTSWYHERRAYGCFRKQEPGIRWEMIAAAEPYTLHWDDWKLLAKERCKCLGYWLVHGINPWKAN